MSEERRTIFETVREDVQFALEGNIADAIKTLQEWEKEYPGAFLSEEYDYDSSNLILKRPRLETDDEYQTRIEREDYHKRAQEARDRLEYQKLKKKFEGQ